MATELLKWGIFGWVQFVLNILIIIIGAIIGSTAIVGQPSAPYGIAIMMAGFSLLVNQFNIVNIAPSKKYSQKTVAMRVN